MKVVPPKLSQAQLQVLLATGTPLDLTRLRMGRSFKDGRHLRLINRKLVDLAAGRIDRLMIRCPPRHGKSNLSSHDFPAWFLGTYPGSRVALTSYSDAIAGQFGELARDTLEEYGHLFGVSISKSSAGKNDWKLDGFGPSGMRSVGIGGGLTGTGADLLIMDDTIKDHADAFSEAMRERAWNWYTSTSSTRLQPGGRILAIGTPWHPDELFQRILNNEGEVSEGGKWEVLRMPAIAEENDILGREIGEPLWPEMFNAAELERKRQSSGPYVWNALYQGRPSKTGRVEFPADWFHGVIHTGELAPDIGDSAIYIDPATGKNMKKGDYSAVVYLGRNRDKLYCRPIIRRMNTDETITRAVSLLKETKAQRFGIEANGFQGELLGRIIEEGKRQGVHVPLYEVQNNEKKEVRIMRLASRLAQRQFLFAVGTDSDLMISQLGDFPVGSHDDGPDALESCVRLIESGTAEAGISLHQAA